ncbi:amidohydrolase [Metabacillus malikii]|uniref:Amidohydrolase n=2 Tax=Metabacillus malikii TaxID=1504265 RepID=A0ABT9ZJ46_9BACI|nr:amidohydrolase [Metabacillus malikii]
MKDLEDHYEEMVDIRRYLHMNPEVSFQEVNTAKYITQFYERIGIEVRSNVGGNGVVAKISGEKQGPTVALRADFDALPIQDEKEVPYKSRVSGVMHACGHDGHTATLLVLAKVLNKHRNLLHGNIVLIHQHAEEYAPGGAYSMIQDGCLDGVDIIFGTHLWATEPVGKIQYKVGPFMAAADRFEITINGKGGHGAQPHKTKDAIVIGSQVVTNLQQIVSRKVDPVQSAVVTVGSFVSENAFNIIADSATLIGTARSFDEEVRLQIEEDIKKVVEGTCLMSDATYHYQYTRGYPAVVNHADETYLLKQIAEKIPEVNVVEESPLQMGGEDFSYYLKRVNGTFFFTGAMPEDSNRAFPHHHPKFDINERALLIAAKTLGMAAIQYQLENVN